MPVNRLILRSNGVVVADIDVRARRRASTIIPSIERDEQDSLTQRVGTVIPSIESDEQDALIQREEEPSYSDSEMSIKEEESASDSDSEMSIKEEEDLSDSASEMSIKEEESLSDSDSEMSIKEEDSPSDSDSPLPELSQSPATPPQYKSLVERFRSYRPKPSPRTWRRISHVVSGRVSKDTPVVNTNKPKIKVVGKWAKHLEYRLPPFNVAREITFPRELTPTKPRRDPVPHSMPRQTV